jgi:hypothetical protein
MRFKQSPIRLHPGEQRTVSLLFDPQRVAPGTTIEIATDPGLSLSLWRGEVPEPGARGWSRVSGSLRALVSAEPGSQLSVFAEAGGYDAELIVLVVRHHASGWVREIARKDEDAHVEAEFEPEAGVVTVYEGRASWTAQPAASSILSISTRPLSSAERYDSIVINLSRFRTIRDLLFVCRVLPAERLVAGTARRPRRATAPSGSTETAVKPAAGEPDESPANRVHRKSPVSRAFSVAGL